MTTYAWTVSPFAPANVNCSGLPMRAAATFAPLMFVTRRASVPSPAEVCDHLGSIGVDVPDCATWLVDSEVGFGEYNDHRLRCYAAAADIDAVRRCEDPIVYMSDSWE